VFISIAAGLKKQKPGGRVVGRWSVLAGQIEVFDVSGNEELVGSAKEPDSVVHTSKSTTRQTRSILEEGAYNHPRL
jgi:hypothetical protein